MSGLEGLPEGSVAIVYCTTKGHTADIAGRIAERIGKSKCHLFLTKELEPATLLPYSLLIFGAPTFGMGDLDRRMQRRLAQIDTEVWEGKKVAFFIMGDQVYHGKTFAGGLERFREFFKALGILPLARWRDEGYEYEESNSVEPDGFFPGLVIDEINQADLSDGRIDGWLHLLGTELSGNSDV